MDAELFMIFAFVLLMTTIVGLTVNGLVSKVLDYKRSLRADGAIGADTSSNQLAERTAMIEDRLSVLERIATDRGQLLSDEIEQLRIDAKPQEQRQ